MRATILRLATAALCCFIHWLSAATPVAAQDCENPVCRSGEVYRVGSGGPAPYGVCGRPCSPPAPCSHYIAACPTGWTLDVPSGICRRDLCGGCGAELALCDSDERYSRSGTASDGRVYGVCEHGTCGPISPCSHQLKYCSEGWTLQTATGMCRKDCAPVARPDLTITSVWLKSRKGALIKSVRAGRSYYACFKVANIGAADSGPFHVGAGGLGVPVAPEQAHAGLTVGSSRAGCLLYPTTPPAGT